MSARRGTPPEQPLSRRRFVALVAASSAAAMALPAARAGAATKRSRRRSAAGSAAKPKPAAPGTAPTQSAAQKEFERQKNSTLATLKTLRAYALPPGGDLAVVFRPLRAARRER